LNSLPNNFIGKFLVPLDEVDSTNEHAKRMMSKSKPPDGTVIIARYQTRGRGQIGKSWESARGENLTFTIILYPEFLVAKRTFSLSEAVCLGLKDFATSLNISVSIKWPNDIYHHDKKLAGLLVENIWMGDKLNYSVVGIGLNVNQTEFSPELPNPTSLRLITGNKFESALLLHSILGYIETWYLQLKSGQYEEIRFQFENSLYGLGKKRLFRAANENFEGAICGVNDEGLLLIQIDGSKRMFRNNEVVYL